MASNTPDLPPLTPNDPVPVPPDGVLTPIPLASLAGPSAECRPPESDIVPLAERAEPAEAASCDPPLLPVFEEADSPPMGFLLEAESAPAVSPPTAADPLLSPCPSCQAPR